eukprot:jgi/Hompol1/5608/HPOL_002232-RA
MDHHCPWVNNCVGHANLKFFFIFVLHGLVFCLIIFITTLLSIWSLTTGEVDTAILMDIHVLLVLIASAVFGVCLVAFVGMQIYLIGTNITTLESIQSIHYARIHGGIVEVSYRTRLYSMRSTRRNFEQVLGTNMWTWFLPLRSWSLC